MEEKKEVILHFDVNETILARDGAGRKSLHDCLVSMLMRNTWGTWEGEVDSVNKDSILFYSQENDVFSEAVVQAEVQRRVEKLQWTFKSFKGCEHAPFDGAVHLDHCLHVLWAPYPEYAPTIDIQERVIRNKLIRKVRNEMKESMFLSFEETHPIKETYWDLLHRLQRRSIDGEGILSIESLKVKYPTSHGLDERKFHEFAPSFLHFLENIELVQCRSIVLRTFGSELLKSLDRIQSCVQSAIERNPSREKLLERYAQIDEECVGKFVRDEHNFLLVMGMHATLNEWKNVPLDEIRSSPGVCHVFCGLHEIYEGMQSLCRKHGLIGIQDHYDYWSQCGERSGSGKIMVVQKGVDGRKDFESKAESKPSRIYAPQLFLDDNIHDEGDQNIVDIRWVDSGESISMAEIPGAFGHIVNPMMAILNERYFLDTILKWKSGLP